MSAYNLAKALGAQCQTPQEKLILVALGDETPDRADGMPVGHVLLSRLASTTAMSAPQLHHYLRQAEDDGHLWIVERFGVSESRGFHYEFLVGAQ